MPTDPYNPKPQGDIAPYEYDAAPHPATKLAWTARLLVYLGLAMAFMAGGPMVKTMAVVGLVVSILSDLEGFTRHALRLVTLGVAIFIASKFGSFVDAFLQLIVGQRSLFGISLGAFVVGLIVFALGTLLTALFVRKVKRNAWANGLNHTAGAVVGAAEGMLLVATLYWSITAFEEPIHKIATDERFEETNELVRQPLIALEQWQKAMRKDPASIWLEQNNYVTSIPIVATTQSLAEIAVDENAIDSIIYSKDIEALLKQDDFSKYYEELKKDPQAKIAIKSRNVRTLIRTPKFNELIAHPKVKAAIRRKLPDIKEALFRTGNEAVQKAAQRLDSEAVDHLPEMARTVAATMDDIPINLGGKAEIELRKLERDSMELSKN